MLTYRPMQIGDIPTGISLCRAAGWNQLGEDWELFLRQSPTGCRVAVDDAGIVRGTVATIQYEDRFSWIGMVLVDPAWQRRGIGRQLLNEALSILHDLQTVKLDATPAGRELYVKLGFQDEYTLYRMECKRVSAVREPHTQSRAIKSSDLPAILAIDREVFGANREALLASSLARCPELAWLVENSNEIVAYCFGRPGQRFAHIGPVVARDINSAKEVALAALAHVEDQPVIIDALPNSSGWTNWLASIGFTNQRPLIRMYRGTNAHPGIPANQFAILGPEFG
jgi:GNAT superfamily N-acetyltransferase